MKKQKPIPRIRFKFADGTHAIAETEYEAQLLRQATDMAASDAPTLRKIGKAQLRRVHERLAAEAQVSRQRKSATELAAQKRRSIGASRADRVRDDLAKGIQPPASPRHVRRILNKDK